MATAITLKDFEGEFSEYEYVERLARFDDKSNLGPLNKPGDFNPQALLESFNMSIEEMKKLYTKNMNKVEKIEKSTYIDVKDHEDTMTSQRSSLQDTNKIYGNLESKVKIVASKVVHLGDQLETANKKRARTEEALHLIKYFNIFQRDEADFNDLIADKQKLFELADIICKLQSFASDLPDKYGEVRSKIDKTSDEIEKALLKEFSHAYAQGGTAQMKKCAKTLSLVQHIENYQGKVTLFHQISHLCQKTQKTILETFDNPEQITAAFVSEVFEKIIKIHVDEELKAVSSESLENYLIKLAELFDKTTTLGNKLVDSKMIIDHHTANKQIKGLFMKYLEKYSEQELINFKEKSETDLEEYYRVLFETTGMQRKTTAQTTGVTSSGARPRRDTIKHLSVDVLFVSQDIITNILSSCREAVIRCKLLCSSNDLSSTLRQLYVSLMTLVGSDHLDYAVELALTVMKATETKLRPNGTFFSVIKMINSSFHLVENQFREIFLPSLSTSSEYVACMKKKKEIMTKIDKNIDEVLDKYLASIMISLKQILVAEQKKSDFKVEEADIAGNLDVTPACQKASIYLMLIVKNIKENLDGQNLKATLTELGLRIHRLLLDHIQLFTYTYYGGIRILCDVTEYRKIIEEFQIPTLLHIMEATYMLCNLLIVPPENLKQVATDAQLATGTLDKSVLMSFIQLRSDFKTAKIAKFLVF